jgi:hypothetical protein
MPRFRLTDWPMLILGGALLAGCAARDDAGTQGHQITEQQLDTDNGLPEINGMDELNGLSGNGLSGNGLSGNGLSGNGLSGNGLSGNGLQLYPLASTGLSNANYLMNSDSGRMTLTYLVKCALPQYHSISKTDINNVPYTFNGQIGVAPGWETGNCDTTCQELVSACMLAHVNTTGQHISIWIDGDSPAIGWGKSSSFPYQEGSFYGNIFVSAPKAYYCNGADFDQGMVPGRLGANQAGAPYKNPLGNGVLCQNRCTWANYTHDGFSSCPDTNNVPYRHVVTVWRNFDPNTNYKICDRASGKCLDTNGSTTPNSTLVQKGYTGAPSQKWGITQLSPGKYKITSVATGMALDTNGSGAGNGTAVVQNPYNGAAKQQWKIGSMADGTGFNTLMVSTSTTQVAGPPQNNQQGEGQPINLWQYLYSDYQKWTISVAN